MQSKWPRVHQIGDWLTSTVRVCPGLLRDDESQGLGSWAPSVFSGESEEAGQSWVRGLPLRTRRG